MDSHRPPSLSCTCTGLCKFLSTHILHSTRNSRKVSECPSVARRRRSRGRAGEICGTSASASGSKVALEKKTGRAVTGINTDRHTPSTHISLHARLEGKKKSHTTPCSHCRDTSHDTTSLYVCFVYAQCHVPFLKLTAGRSQAVPSRCPSEIDRNNLFSRSMVPNKLVTPEEKKNYKTCFRCMLGPRRDFESGQANP